MSHSNKQRQVPLLTEGELQHTTQQHDMAYADDWSQKSVSIASIVKTIRAAVGTDNNPHSIDHAVDRSAIESAQFDVGVDMITVRMDARSMKGDPQDVFGPESISIRPCVPRRGTRAEAPKVSQADQVTRKWSKALYIFESPVRVTVGGPSEPAQ